MLQAQGRGAGGAEVGDIGFSSMALSLETSLGGKLPQQWEPILLPTSAVGTLSSSGQTGSAASLCHLPSPWAAPLPPPCCPGLLSLGSGCLVLLMSVGAVLP